MKHTGMLVAFAGGAIAGAIFGVLISPDKGSNIRRKLGSAVHKEGHNFKVKLKHYLEQQGIKLDCCQLDSLVDDLIDNDSPVIDEEDNN